MSNSIITIRKRCYQGEIKPNSVKESRMIFVFEDDEIVNAVYRRKVMCKKSKSVALEIPVVNINSRELLFLMSKVVNNKDYIYKNKKELSDYLSKFEITFSNDKNIYEIPINYEFGDKILKCVNFAKYNSMEIKDMIKVISNSIK